MNWRLKMYRKNYTFKTILLIQNPYFIGIVNLIVSSLFKITV